MIAAIADLFMIDSSRDGRLALKGGRVDTLAFLAAHGRIRHAKAEEIATVKEVAKRSNEAFSEGLKAFGETFKASVAEVIDEAGELID